MSNIKVIVCSKNKAKNDAVNQVIKDFISDYEILSLETSSNVSETPISDEEGIMGLMECLQMDAIQELMSLLILFCAPFQV